MQRRPAILGVGTMRRRWNTGGRGAGSRVGAFATAAGRCTCDDPNCVDYVGRLDGWAGFDEAELLASTSTLATPPSGMLTPREVVPDGAEPGGPPPPPSSSLPSSSSSSSSVAVAPAPAPAALDGSRAERAGPAALAAKGTDAARPGLQGNDAVGGGQSKKRHKRPGGAPSSSSSSSSSPSSAGGKSVGGEGSGRQMGREAGPRDGRCAFFLKKKRRYCSMRPGPGKHFCGVHEAEGADGSAMAGAAAGRKQRVPCPLDPSHTVFAHDVERHVKVCVAGRQQREAEAQPYFQRGLNSGRPAASAAAAAAATTAVAPQRQEQQRHEATTALLPRGVGGGGGSGSGSTDLQALAVRVGELYEQHVGALPARHLPRAQLRQLLHHAEVRAEHPPTPGQRVCASVGRSIGLSVCPPARLPACLELHVALPASVRWRGSLPVTASVASAAVQGR
eukprot:COSAG01_NODE_5174_length_4433_cov_2.338486_1_plen_449_part_00